MILNYSGKREKRKLIYFSERKNDQGLKAVHPLQGGSNAKEEYGTKGHKTSNSTGTSSKEKEKAAPCPVRMMRDIRMTNGIRIQQRYLTYQNLKSLIEKLKELC